MLEIKGVNGEAFKHLIKIPPRLWSTSRFKTSKSYDTFVNNMPEAFNFIFVIARVKLIVIILEEIIVYLMQQWESNRQMIAKYEDTILPNIRKGWQKNHKK